MKRPHIVARFGGAVLLNAIQVAKAMQDLGFEVIRRHSSRVWVVSCVLRQISVDFCLNLMNFLKQLKVKKITTAISRFSILLRQVRQVYYTNNTRI